MIKVNFKPSSTRPRSKSRCLSSQAAQPGLCQKAHATCGEAVLRELGRGGRLRKATPREQMSPAPTNRLLVFFFTQARAANETLAIISVRNFFCEGWKSAPTRLKDGAGGGKPTLSGPPSGCRCPHPQRPPPTEKALKEEGGGENLSKCRLNKRKKQH